MHDIRKPYNRLNSNPGHDLRSRVEQFESRSYQNSEQYEEPENDNGAVQIPGKRFRRNLSDMEMYPKRKHGDIENKNIQDENYESVESNNQVKKRRKEGSLGMWIFIISIIFLAVGAGLFTYVFNTATITVVPKNKDIDFNKTILFTQNKEDGAKVSFVTETVSATKSKKLALSESKKIEAKASGKVIIYNNYDDSSQKLIKNTRLESSAGKIYRINQSVTVPGKKGSTPGSVEVMIYADGSGTSYNSDATDFSIPGFKGTPREKNFYARSKGAISGGSSGNVSLASLSDINAAKDELALELAQEVKTKGLAIKKSNYLGLYGASEVLYVDNEEDVLKGVTDTYQVTATAYIIFADATKLASVVASNSFSYNNEIVRLGYEETLNYTRKDTDHIASSTDLSLLVEGKPRIIWVSDFEAIKDIVKGKKRDEFKPLMKTLPNVIGAEISFSPLWLSSFPNDISKINIIESLPKR